MRKKTSKESLVKKLSLSDQRPEIVKACCDLLEQEVRRKSGFTGIVLKTGYKTVQAVKPGLIQEMVDDLLDDFLEVLEPVHADYEKGGAKGTFGAFIKSHKHQVAEAMLATTDQRAGKAKNELLKNAYQRLRPFALQHVEEALPGLASLIDRFYRR
jgi:hypothetical protein